jgi:hypothetical protein
VAFVGIADLQLLHIEIEARPHKLIYQITENVIFALSEFRNRGFIYHALTGKMFKHDYPLQTIFCSLQTCINFQSLKYKFFKIINLKKNE